MLAALPLLFQDCNTAPLRQCWKASGTGEEGFSLCTFVAYNAVPTTERGRIRFSNPEWSHS